MERQSLSFMSQDQFDSATGLFPPRWASAWGDTIDYGVYAAAQAGNQPESPSIRFALVPLAYKPFWISLINPGSPDRFLAMDDSEGAPNNGPLRSEAETLILSFNEVARTSQEGNNVYVFPTAAHLQAGMEYLSILPECPVSKATISALCSPSPPQLIVAICPRYSLVNSRMQR